MEILVFRTSSDATMYKLLEEIKGNQVDCLIQSSQVRRYIEKYSEINFIDIHSEGFYDLSDNIYDMVSNKKYDEIYITFSGVIGHNYGNIIEIVKRISFRKAYFYNCNGERVNIPQPNVFKDFLCKVYIEIIQLLF